MNRRFIPFAFAALCLPAAAQQYIIVNDDVPVLADDVLRITYEPDDQFETRLLPGMLAADPKTQLFSQALQLTGLADTLRSYIYSDYEAPYERKYYYLSDFWHEVAWYNTNRYKMYTVFAETDDVLATQGISSMDQLKAYAKRIYDEVFPADATVSDPTDRRNSLNRFVAYHILPFGASYWYLTPYDGKKTDKFYDTTLTDITAWYGTLMPLAALKCSYPMGNERGVFLNHRGLQDGPDKYGLQVRGVKIVASTGEAEPFTHKAFNGYYYHIDSILAYDQTTRNDVLGSDRWCVDFKMLLPDIMNNADELRGNYLNDDSNSTPDDSPNPKNGRNYIYKWDSMENITCTEDDSNPGLVARRAHCNFWSWLGDEMNVFGNFGTIGIKLPPLPAGEWEVRLGYCALPARNLHLKVWLNDTMVTETLDMSKYYYSADLPFWKQNIQEDILNYMRENVFVVTTNTTNVIGQYVVTDVKTGESMVYYSDRDPYDALKEQITQYFGGFDVETGERVNWTERAREYREQTTKDYIATLPKVMYFPPECFHFNSGGSRYRYTEDDETGNYRCLRAILGRIQSDGKSDNYVRLEFKGVDNVLNYSELQFDFFELVPKFVYDNPTIPEE